MPFDSSPDEGSGGSENAFWERVHKVAACSYAFLLPRVLGPHFRLPTDGCLGMWTPEDQNMHALCWGNENRDLLEANEYADLVISMVKITGPNPTHGQAIEALGLVQHGAIYATKVNDTPLFLALASNKESGAMQVAGMLSMCHIFGDPLENFKDACENNVYWYAMYRYFATVDVRTFFAS